MQDIPTVFWQLLSWGLSIVLASLALWFKHNGRRQFLQKHIPICQTLQCKQRLGKNVEHLSLLHMKIKTSLRTCNLKRTTGAILLQIKEIFFKIFWAFWTFLNYLNFFHHQFQQINRFQKKVAANKQLGKFKTNLKPVHSQFRPHSKPLQTWLKTGLKPV